ncbi:MULTISPECIES: response regulator [Pseudoalteromonas]|uniref:Chemotaxis protein CheY n=1 Tax=Pseudoalteromonas ruthenica TaxID=151081 RepID=A0A0F4PZV6_9GAMM|nr:MULTISPECIES: response regulator [Pseudoalteromonas]KJY99111.1 chemotaxis protein CheY [Pseudoalteromonas ruthenica]KJY99846.1 chemotaxis protein CheY [Pseudoalteromonas ruthenica]MCF2861636.1 response regulator [Pseudoalteromonas sp. CNAT2-18]MCG7542595.1 response regulator [Pseudoalteromonas sp. MM17-2]MCG7557326.1 response regulator [Pseudoalteromonas sp. CNAT2-18.1]|tara:strand:- start:536 stop:916 length:381 start_codon:yes stop_codon:yes gene_type:complete
MEFVRPLEPILIIDDDQSMRSSLTTILTELGYDQVAVATDVAEAKPLLSQLEPEVIFVDIALPDTDGCDVVSYLKDLHPHSRIILCADHNSQENVEHSWEFGAQEYISKPFNANKVDMVMKRLELN